MDFRYARRLCRGPSPWHTAAPLPAEASSWALLPFLGGCGGDGVLGPDADLTFLVGDWEAENLIVRSKENLDLASELIGELGAEYTL